MKLLIQPEDGIAPLVAAIRHARKSVDIVIFRCDRICVVEMPLAAGGADDVNTGEERRAWA